MKEALQDGNVQGVMKLLEDDLSLALKQVFTGTGSRVAGAANTLSKKLGREEVVKGNELPLDYILRKIEEEELPADKIIS